MGLVDAGMIGGAQDNNIPVLKKWINDEVACNKRDADGNTPLHVAVRAGSLDAVHYLIEHGAIVDAVNDQGMRPLHLGVRAEKRDCCLVLLHCGELPQCTGPNTKAPPPNQFAGELGLQEYLQLFLEYVPSPLLPNAA